MKKFRTMGVLMLCSILLSLLAACGGSSGQGTQNGKATVTVMTWETDSTNASIDKALQDFMKSNSDITVQRIPSPAASYGDKLASLLQAKKLPDLFWCGNDTEQQYTAQGLLYDYAPKLKNGQGSTLSSGSFVPAALQNWTSSDGKMGGLPTLMNTSGIWYNADAFKKAGLELPKQGWTWDQMFSDAQKLTSKSGGTTNYGLVADGLTQPANGPFTMSAYSLSAGGQAFADKINNTTKVTVDDKYIEGVSKLAAAIQNGSVSPPGYDVSNATSSFTAGKIPMLLSGQWLAAGFLTNKPSISYGFAPLPTVSSPATLYDAVGICTPSYTANPDATWKVMQFMASKLWENVLPSSPVAPPAYTPSATNYNSTLKSPGMDSVVSTVTYELNTSNVSGVRFSTVWATKANDLMTTYWPDILQGKKPVSALQTMASQVNDLIQSNTNT